MPVRAEDTKGRFGANTVYFIPTADQALLGLFEFLGCVFFSSNRPVRPSKTRARRILRFFSVHTLKGFR